MDTPDQQDGTADLTHPGQPDNAGAITGDIDTGTSDPTPADDTQAQAEVDAAAQQLEEAPATTEPDPRKQAIAEAKAVYKDATDAFYKVRKGREGYDEALAAKNAAAAALAVARKR